VLAAVAVAAAVAAVAAAAVSAITFNYERWKKERKKESMKTKISILLCMRNVVYFYDGRNLATAVFVSYISLASISLLFHPTM